MCEQTLADFVYVVVLGRGIYPLGVTNQLKIFNQAASTRCFDDNKEKLSTDIRSEYESDFCHDRKLAFRHLLSCDTIVSDYFETNTEYLPQYPSDHF